MTHRLALTLLLAIVWLPAVASADDSPISLSDPDGQELILEDLAVRAAIHGPLALTEMDFRFRNPTSRRIEGRFSCTLPVGAAISRFAKDVSGHLMEGEVVERLRANQVYEQFLHQMRDPALLEQDQGNRFSARIFPIEPNADVRIVLSYTRLLPLRNGQRTFTLPLRGISKIANFSFRAFVSRLPGEESTGAPSTTTFEGSGVSRSSVDVLSREERDYTPTRDIELSWRPSATAARNRILRAGDFYLASFRPNLRATANAVPSKWLFYVDTSASSAEGAKQRIEALQSLFRALPAGDRVEVFAFDNRVAMLRSGTAGELTRSIAELLRTRMFLGGTDLDGAIRHAAQAAASNAGAAVVFVSDLVPTLGKTSQSDILSAAGALPARTRVHALILGDREDAQVARALTAGRGRVVRIPFSDAIVERGREAAAALRRPLGTSVELRDTAAEWVYPGRADDVQPGDEVIVLGKVRAGLDPAIAMAGVADGVVTTALPGKTYAPLLEREAYRAYLDYLAEREAAEPSEAVQKALATEAVKVSIEQRVVIPRTTMLVLETEFDFQRFNIDRRALAAILTVGAGGIERIDRSRELPRPVPVTTQIAPPPRVRREAMKQSTRAVPEARTVMTEEAAPPIEQDMAAVAMAPASAPPPPPAPRSPAISQGRAAGAAAVDARDARRSTKTQSRSWTSVKRPSAEAIDRLFAALKRNPGDRELYNQLSDALVLTARWEELRSLALRWQPYDPENPQVYEILGLAAEHLARDGEAARAFASLIEIAPAKGELLQRAGLLLVRLGEARLAVAPLRRALELRPDRVNSYRHLALMLWLDDRPEEAARVLESATKQAFPAWYGDAQRVVREELGYVYRSWRAKSPGRAADIEARAREYKADMSRRDALRVSLAWETDANDVDLHVADPGGAECFYGSPSTSSGLQLYGDITQGLGPEVIRSAKVTPGRYHVGVRYFAAGPMGISRGLVVVVRERQGEEPVVAVHPFRLAQGGGEIRYVAAVDVK
jgi:Flp pilus assembly protein TadD